MEAEGDETHIFPEDVVSLIGPERSAALPTDDPDREEDRPRKVGIVCRVAGETYPDEQDEDGEVIPQGFCAVCWIGHTAQQPDTIANTKLEVVDRCFLYGDVVAPVTASTGQAGTVINVSITANLRWLKSGVKATIDSNSLAHICPIKLGSFVVVSGPA